jgi:hypothetical protein
MLNGKYVNIDRIIEGVYRDFGWTHEVDYLDCIEWTGECLDLIAAPKQYIKKVTDGNEELGHPCPVIIKNYRGSLPCELINITQVRENKSKTIMRYTSDSFHIGLKKSEENLPLVSDTYQRTIGIESDLALTPPLLRAQDSSTDLTYMITNNHIYCNFKDGEIELSYVALPTDKEGMPLVPDNIKYIQATKYYIAEKIAQKMFIQGKLEAQRFQYIQQQRDWYLGAATTAGLMPSVDEMETWKNMFVRLIPNINQHSNGFKNAGDQQKRINHNSI